MIRLSITVVIPARNAAATLLDQLDALANQTRVPDEVIVVDDGSTDGTATVATRHHLAAAGTLRVLRPGRVGLNGARNLGADSAVGVVVAFTDADDLVDQRWVEALLDENPVGDEILGGRIVNRDGPGHPQLWPADRLPVALGYHPYALGTNLALNATTLMRLGGFDERWPPGATEVELCMRAVQQGLRIRYVPDAVVAHGHRSTARAAMRQAFNYGRGDIRLRRRFGPPPSKAARRSRSALHRAVTLAPKRLPAEVLRLGSHVVGMAYEHSRPNRRDDRSHR